MSFIRRHLHPKDTTEVEQDEDENIDPELRLRTVRTAASTIAESIRSEQRAQRRKSTRKKRTIFRPKTGEKKRPDTTATTDSVVSEAPPPPSVVQVTGPRRNVYVNQPLSAMEVDAHGEPTARYARNKVRTTKYTVLTFIPKNLYEQFRRVANLYFLALVVAQLFPVFGAAGGQIAMLPLVFILIVTAIKDAIEDYRRARLDEEVNTSAATKLGGWRNVNQPLDPRPWWKRALRINPPGTVTKGVRRLREKEASEGNRIMLMRADPRGGSMSTDFNESSFSIDGGVRRLEDIQSIDSHSYPPPVFGDVSQASLSAPNQMGMSTDKVDKFMQTKSLSPYQQSLRSESTLGVMDWRKRATGSARWERTLWKKLEVGDIVLLRENDQVPADIVVLATSDPDGMCYLETKNLDGETNLKPRKALRATSTIGSEEDIERSSFVLDSEPPHQNLYDYHGVLRYKDPVTGEEKQDTATINDFLLRGCSLRNTSWVIGLVVFTGADTKIMLNGGSTPSKRSKIERETNFNVIVNFAVLIVMCVITSIANGIYDGQNTTSADFYEVDVNGSDSSVLDALITLVSSLIAFQNIVPISLYISIEIVKTIQAYFISQDVDMYYAPYDTACVPKTWNISDDLGQIEYIFSDKTGTLTQNIMEFQKCSVAGVVYGEGVTEAQRGAATREGRADTINPHDLQAKLDDLRKTMMATMARGFKNRYIQPDRLTLVSPKLADDLVDRSSPQRANLIAFFRALALCHSVLAERSESAAEPYRLLYKAESPDEAALVSAARDVGFPFVAKSKDTLDIEVMGQGERYTLLRLLEFNSTRKRMSVVVRAPDGRLVLYCKGADSVIYERLALDHDPALKEQTAKDMEAFANSGLRTLCIAYRDISDEEFLTWSQKYDAATAATKDRDEEIDKANEMIEHSLTILGATALEDKLQEGVPEAIELLHQAGIKLWILTGDKVQTAIEIGFSCNLLKSDMEIMILSADSIHSARLQIEGGLNKMASILGPPSWDPRKRGFLPNAKASFAVVIDGDTLRHALSPELKQLFLNLGTQCETVVCCRVSPAQKALTVNLVKEGRKAMTLSIGDGANDVAMIQEANIGCGLFGLEGSQAAMSADFAFGQFRFLTKLLLVHGRWSYQRIADMHSNFFYKNVIWTFAMFWYLPWNSFDATYLYEYTFILLYNLVFTSLPVIALGAFDQDINSKAALAFPQLYVRGIRGLEYTRAKFWSYMLDGLYQSAVVYFVGYGAWAIGPALSWDGRGIDSLADFGTTISVAAIFAANTFVGLNTHYWTVITWVVVIGSSLVMIIWIIIYSFFQSPDFINEVIILFGGITFWATVLISVAISLVPRIVWKYFASTYMPLDKDIVREMWVKGDLKDQLGLRRRKGDDSDIKNATAVDDPEHTPIFDESHSASSSSPGTSPQRLHPPSSLTRLDNGYEVHPHEPRAADEHGLRANSERHNSYRGSYYSVSDLPPPSPLPTPLYKYSSGEYTTQSPPSRKSTVSRRTDLLSPPTSPPLPNSAAASLNSPSQYISYSDPNPGMYEMRIRSPPQSVSIQQQPPYGQHASSSLEPSRGVALRQASDSSYDTAKEGWLEDEQEDEGVAPAPATPTQWRTSEDVTDNETITDRYADRRYSNYPGEEPESATSWSGAHAL